MAFVKRAERFSAAVARALPTLPSPARRAQALGYNYEARLRGLRFILGPTKNLRPGSGRRITSWFHPTSDCRFQIVDFRLEIEHSSIYNLQSTIYNPSGGFYRGQPRFHTCRLALRKRLRGGVAWLVAEHARSRWRALPEGCGQATCPRQRSICICSPNHSTRNRSRQVGNWAEMAWRKGHRRSGVRTTKTTITADVGDPRDRPQWDQCGSSWANTRYRPYDCDGWH